MLGDCRIDDLAPERFQGRERADLISAHQSGIAGDISRQHRRQSSLYPPAGHKALPLCTKRPYQSIGVAFLPEHWSPDYSGKGISALGHSRRFSLSRGCPAMGEEPKSRRWTVPRPEHRLTDGHGQSLASFCLAQVRHCAVDAPLPGQLPDSLPASSFLATRM